MRVDEMKNFLGKVNSSMFGLRVLRCVQYKVYGFTTFLGSSLLGQSSVVDMGINIKTGLCQRLLAHSASQVAVAVGKVDSLTQGVAKHFVNTIKSRKSTDAARGIATRNAGEEIMRCGNGHDTEHGMNGFRFFELNNNEDALRKSKSSLSSPLSNLSPMLSAAKKTAVSCKSVTSQMVSNISQSIPLGVGGKPKKSTALVEDKVLESNAEVQSEDQRKNVLIEHLTLSLLFMTAIIYVTIYSCITQLLLLLENTIVMVRVVIGATMDWIYQRRLGFFITILAAVNIMLLADCSL